MTDQVNPLGSSLAPGMAQTRQVATSLPSKPAPKPVEPKAQPSQEKQGELVPQESLNAAAKDVQDYLKQAPSDIKYVVDKATGMLYFQVLNPVTHEVIRQVPAEEILAMARKLRELSKTQDAPGVLLDEEG